MRNSPARLLLVDDHALVREGVRLILEQEPDLSVVAEAGDGAEAIGLIRRTPIDLVILDIAMPRMTGLQAAREITRGRPRERPIPKLLMLSMHDNEQYLFEALKAGASGYVLKSVADDDLVTACRAALRGEAFLYPSAMTALMRDYTARLAQGERLPHTVLTEREDQVLKLIAEGLTSKEIAKLLTIALKTVENHRANILAKLDMRDRTQLTRYAIRAGLIEP
jgi:DNA-binding NarL/FixJ family response regulator